MQLPIDNNAIIKSITILSLFILWSFINSPAKLKLFKDDLLAFYNIYIEKEYCASTVITSPKSNCTV